MSLHFNFPSNIQVGGGREDANACLVCGKVSCVHCGLNSNQCMWFDSTCLFCTAGRVSIVCGGLGMYRGATHVQYDVRQLWENPADTFEEWQKNERGGGHRGAFVAFQFSQGAGKCFEHIVWLHSSGSI